MFRPQGVPAFYRWLTKRYKRLTAEQGQGCDRLYLDLNGIVHQRAGTMNNVSGQVSVEYSITAQHPALDEYELCEEVCAYTERLVELVQPQELLYIALDGVAPRAKMNQQRARRFRSANGPWDTNAITPGTQFMRRLNDHLRKWILDKMAKDLQWQEVTVLFSDSSVPGEGEHKIVEFIRSQRSSAKYNVLTRHIIYGLDADLILLGLATHEASVVILRENFFMENPQYNKFGPPEFIFLDLRALRRGIELELASDALTPDANNAINDWLLLVSLTGNDFIPSLLGLQIRDGALDLLVRRWHACVPAMAGYLTENGRVALNRLSIFMQDLGTEEEAIFRRGHEEQLIWKERRSMADEEEEEDDFVHLWEPGYKSRYYNQKFVQWGDGVKNEITEAYVKGLMWVSDYYFQGTPDWDWYYPYYFAPFASDLVTIPDIECRWEKHGPLRPLEQLMAVLPPVSEDCLPPVFRPLLVHPDSPLRHVWDETQRTEIDYYPEELMIDRNGEERHWLQVLLLPFVDKTTLLEAMAHPQAFLDIPLDKYEAKQDDPPYTAYLDEEERELNTNGANRVFVCRTNPDYNFLLGVTEAVPLPASSSLVGTVSSALCDESQLAVELEYALIPTVHEAKSLPGSSQSRADQQTQGVVSYDRSKPKRRKIEEIINAARRV